MTSRSVSWPKVATGAAAVLVLAGLYWWLWDSGMLAALADENSLRDRIGRLGFWGPLGVILLMAMAIVMSPVPSGPIAVVAGAAFGPAMGTLYTVIGAEAGAIIAFWIARCLGFETVRRWSKAEPLLERLSQSRSQTWLMAVVFASRLVPFLSFDAVSYAAGLTPLAFWRFALATLAGVVPVSFALAYFGEELVSASPGWMLGLAVLIGGVTLVPIALRFLWVRSRGK